ncbi:DUF4345 domain-containing protein [Herpetosiphon geysericola]|uniref:DUF4345 domain-containing protein n=1 Tax=Herpetosiphon geysericola TaxID=70996 RepID=A0A0P6YDI7_9CHLR|nr:DUF4345 domain-containing protein [Herpetosiphon geysericola]KPL90128.1 hypothetical protein SE18_07910 [Herpetosiphon geysericola]
MQRASLMGLKIVLVLVGLYSLYISLDFGIGGFETLGWQGAPPHVADPNNLRFGVQDSHFRFLAGVFGTLGVCILLAVRDLAKYRLLLQTIFTAFIVGGLLRFSANNFAVLLRSEVLIALIAEIGLMLGLHWWLQQALKAAPLTQQSGQGVSHRE